MYFDWITWSIWLLGFVILIIWVYVPYKEFRKILSAHQKNKNSSKESE